jgi:hypothetical protein
MVMRITFAIGEFFLSMHQYWLVVLTEYRFGGEAVSLAVNYIHSEEFAAAGYTPFMADGTEYREVRQYGNFSFLRVYEAR